MWVSSRFGMKVVLLLLMSSIDIASPRVVKKKDQAPQLKHVKDHRIRNRKTDFKMQFDKDVHADIGPIVVELMVVVDETACNYHGNDTKNYVVTVMNTVQKLWQSPSLATNVTLQINKFVILFKQPEDLTPVEDGNLYLKKFCSWQRRVGAIEGESLYYDTTLLITRTNLHIGGNYEATGVGYIMGACDFKHQCSVNEDTHPMGLAMTIAHEIGHNLGMWHDGSGNQCPDSTFLMSGYSTGGPRSLLWSQCSREAMRKFLRSPTPVCLQNVSSESLISLVDQSLPGLKYDADFQCRVLYGPQARDCSEWRGERKCGELRCYSNNESHHCQTEKRPPLDGTKCGPNAVCLSGYCKVVQNTPPLPIFKDRHKTFSYSHTSAPIPKANRQLRRKQPVDENSEIRQRYDINKRAQLIYDLNKDSEQFRIRITYMALLILSFCLFFVVYGKLRRRRICRSIRI